MSAPAGSTTTRARARRATVARAVVHYVPVLHSDVQQQQAALCGFRPADPWVLRPSWPKDKLCPLCAERLGEVEL